jgi:hypothetical protein
MSLFNRFADWLVLGVGCSRSPDFVIGGWQNPYLLRWWLTPWSGGSSNTPEHQKTWWQRVLAVLPGVYLHNFWRSDDDRALHDHPWLFNCSILLQGEYDEHTIERGGIHRRTRLRAGDWRFRWGPAPHRVELIDDRQCWTLFITGPRVRSWGFHCAERGWIHWKAFTDPADHGKRGRGCDA